VALDPSIALGIRPPEFQNPMQTLGSLMQLRAQQQQLQSNSLQMQQQERAIRDEQAIRGAIQRRARPGALPDYDSAAADLDAAGFGTAAVKLRDGIFEQRKKTAEGLKTQFENSETRLKLASQIAQGIGDEGSFQRGKKAIAGLLGEDLASQLGDAYDPKRMTEVVSWGRTASDELSAQRNAVEAANKALELTMTSARDAEAAKKNAPEIAANWLKAGSQVFSVARNQEDWTKARTAADRLGMPASILDRFGPQWSPEAQQQAATLGITTEKRAELAGQAEGRAQTAAYQRGQLALGAERIGIARKQLAAAQTQPEAMGPVADMVLDNPDLLKDFTPKERGKILTHIATQRDGAMPNKRRESLLSMLDATDATISQLETGSGMSGAVGAKGPASLFGYRDEPMAGTAAADYTSYFNTLKSQLTLPRMEMMRGLGAMSEREFKTLGDSATALNRSMSEKAFKSELTKVKETLGAVRLRLQGAVTPTNTAPGSPGSTVPLLPSSSGTVKMRAPTGQMMDVPAGEVGHYKARGAQVVP
jgi:hypothetical protein